MDIQKNVARVRAQIDSAALAAGRNPAEVTLVAATKTQTSDAIRQAITAGVAVCGENRVQELTAHLADGAYDGAELHFIGHLQTNKVKYVVGRVSLVHSVSSEKLLLAIDAQADKVGAVQDILLEVNLAGEESKSGFVPEEVLSAAGLCARLNHVRLRGLMCIPPAAQAPGGNLSYFQKLKQLAVDIRRKIEDNRIDMDILSMGMSGDYPDAIAAGATHIRVGTALFGPRPPVSVHF